MEAIQRSLLLMQRRKVTCCEKGQMKNGWFKNKLCLLLPFQSNLFLLPSLLLGRQLLNLADADCFPFRSQCEPSQKRGNIERIARDAPGNFDHENSLLSNLCESGALAAHPLPVCDLEDLRNCAFLLDAVRVENRLSPATEDWAVLGHVDNDQLSDDLVNAVPSEGREKRASQRNWV